MIYDKDTNIVHLSPWLEDCFPIFYKRFTSLLGEHVISYKILPHTNDLWCRDGIPAKTTATTVTSAPSVQINETSANVSVEVTSAEPTVTATVTPTPAPTSNNDIDSLLADL